MRFSTMALKLFVLICLSILVIDCLARMAGKLTSTPAVTEQQNRTCSCMQASPNMSAQMVKQVYVRLADSCKGKPHVDGETCTVIVSRLVCFIVPTYPTPQEVCYWQHETILGRWNAARDCCEAVVNGVVVCVK